MSKEFSEILRNPVSSWNCVKRNKTMGTHLSHRCRSSSVPQRLCHVHRSCDLEPITGLSAHGVHVRHVTAEASGSRSWAMCVMSLLMEQRGTLELRQCWNGVGGRGGYPFFSFSFFTKSQKTHLITPERFYGCLWTIPKHYYPHTNTYFPCMS